MVIALIVITVIVFFLMNTASQSSVSSEKRVVVPRPESEAIPIIDQWAKRSRGDILNLKQKLRKEGFDFTRARLIELYDERSILALDEHQTKEKQDASAINYAQPNIVALVRRLTSEADGALTALSREHIETLHASLLKQDIRVNKNMLRADVERQSIAILASRLVKARLNPPSTVSIAPEMIETFVEVCRKKGYTTKPVEQQDIIYNQQVEYLVNWIECKAGIRPHTSKACVSTYISLFGENYEHVEWFQRCFPDELEGVDFRVLLDAEEARQTRANKEQKVLMDIISPAVTKGTPTAPCIDEMSGEEFEIFLEELFKRMGYKVHRTPLSNDQGADLIVERLGLKTAVQAKRYAGPVSNSAVQEIVAAKAHYDCDQAIVVTNSTFTRSAKKLATSNKVELWDHSNLGRLRAAHF